MIAVVLAVLFPQGVGLRRDLPQRHRVRKSREDAVFCRRVAGVIGREKKRDSVRVDVRASRGAAVLHPCQEKKGSYIFWTTTFRDELWTLPKLTLVGSMVMPICHSVLPVLSVKLRVS